MRDFKPMRELPDTAEWSSQDVLVVFGELFQRGYANGIVDQAKAKGMKVIYSTVGRRDENQQLRALNEQELLEKESPLINVPLEAGFDLEPDSSGKTPVDQLKGIKMSAWNLAQLDWTALKESRQLATESFRLRVKAYLVELEKMLPDNSNILFVHTMAGGFPRAKVVMPIANKVFKGYDDRFCSSESFWQSEIGRLCDLNFKDVTGETLNHLIDLTKELREKKKKQNLKVSYVAYGYHGTEVLVLNKYKWQSYSPYLQGWAKKHLENIAKENYNKNIQCCVFNCPEILTNSSSIFLGVEVSLYPLLGALQKEGLSLPEAQNILSECQSLLKPGIDIDEVLKFCTKYLTSSTIKAWTQYDLWPQHNGNEQMKLMRESSAELINMHKDTKDLITYKLSEVVFRACGKIMFNEAWKIQQPVVWLGHDIIAKQTLN
ncbi:MAG: hypothetical protein H6625_11920 [Bdellovibrionaceae bacterium]|nr:hypothetical protein [Pseudobdellovibrionaceae bacterium]